MPDVFIQGMVSLQPQSAMFENVYGFCLPEKAGSRVTPLSRFVKKCAQVLPDYDVVVFILNANSHLTFSRRRLYVLLLNKTCVVRGARELVVRLVEDLSCVRW